jgi:NADH-quinone oxidoreductase subunit M
MVTDLHAREVAALAPLVALIFGLGFFPQVLLDVINPTVEATLEEVGVDDPEPAAPVEADSQITQDQESAQ